MKKILIILSLLIIILIGYKENEIKRGFHPEKYLIEGTDCEFCFLPYILERDRKDIQDYFPIQEAKKRIIFSHNDIKGINYGNFESPEGFDTDDVESNCDLFINGHIHHYGIHNNIINVGNLTGQNFTEDFSYKHGVYVLDTEALNGLWVDNPYAIYNENWRMEEFIDNTKTYLTSQQFVDNGLKVIYEVNP